MRRQTHAAFDIVEGITQRDNRSRHVASDERRKRRQRHGRIVGWQEDPSTRVGGPLFEVQVGDHKQPFLRPIQRAHRVGDKARGAEVQGKG